MGLVDGGGGSAGMERGRVNRSHGEKQDEHCVGKKKRYFVSHMVELR